jgi:hypothetical protein
VQQELYIGSISGVRRNRRKYAPLRGVEWFQTPIRPVPSQSVSTPQPTLAALANGTEYHVDMRRIFPQCLDANPSDRSAKADVLLREESDEDEDEEEDEGDRKEDDEDEDRDDGYSE